MTLSAGARRQLGVTLLTNLLVPIALYNVLSSHMSMLHALMIVAGVSGLENTIGFLRRGRLDALGVLVLGGLVLGGVLVLFGGSARLILIRESLLIGAFGVIFLASLLFSRPVFYFIAEGAPSVTTDFAGGEMRTRWEDPHFRTFLRSLTGVSGVCMVLESGINTYLAFHLPVATYLGVSQVVRFSLAGVILLCTVGLARCYRNSRGGGRVPELNGA